MKRIFSMLCGALIANMIVAQQPISDPNVQVREAKGFHAIHVGSAFKVIMTEGTEEKVAVSAASAKDVADIVVVVKNEVLYIGWDHKVKWGRGNKKLKAYISYRKIDELVVSGACNVDIQGTLKADKDLKIDLSGASDLSGNFEVGQKLTIELSGASDAKFSGSAQTMSIDANGASKFKGFDFTVEYCDASASGASDIRITVNKELKADASGASAVGYKGSAVIRDLKTSGASHVSRSS